MQKPNMGLDFNPHILRDTGHAQPQNWRDPLAYSPEVTLQNDYDISLWQSKVQSGAFRQRNLPATSGRGAVDPKLAQIFAYGKWLYPHRIQLQGASDLDQRCLKTRNSKDGCTFPPNIFTIIPKITPKPHFGDLSMQNLLYRQLSVIVTC